MGFLGGGRGGLYLPFFVCVVLQWGRVKFSLSYPSKKTTLLLKWTTEGNNRFLCLFFLIIWLMELGRLKKTNGMKFFECAAETRDVLAQGIHCLINLASDSLINRLPAISCFPALLN